MDSDARDAFVVAEHPRLVRTGYLLTGSQVEAEDLAQETCIRVMQKWRQVARVDDPSAYSRRILLNLLLANRRRRWAGEQPTADVPDSLVPPATDAVDSWDVLRRALLAMPIRQRATVVLRHYEHRTEAEVAVLLGISIGTVKSLTSRGLDGLRARLGSEV